ncbi:MAG: MlaD family protein [Rhodospirillaceae bacterium]
MSKLIRPEVWVGSVVAIVLLCIVLFAFLGFGLSNTDSAHGLRLKAEFGRIDGLNVGSNVRLAGINVGVVEIIKLQNNRRAQITLLINKVDLPIPVDTAAVIESDGIFGEKYVELYPGGELENLMSGQEIEFSQDSVLLEGLLRQVAEQATRK